MKKLTFILECFEHKELKPYLLSLKGITDVKTKNDDKLIIDIKYNENLIIDKIIKLEIETFLQIKKNPSLIGFDKHQDKNIEKYNINKENKSCEYCAKRLVDNLFEIKGINKVTINNDNYNNMTIYYDKNKITEKELKEIENKLP